MRNHKRNAAAPRASPRCRSDSAPVSGLEALDFGTCRLSTKFTVRGRFYNRLCPLGHPLAASPSPEIIASNDLRVFASRSRCKNSVGLNAVGREFSCGLESDSKVQEGLQSFRSMSRI